MRIRSRGLDPYAWAWQLGDGSLCYWAEPTKEKLLRGQKPSPEAQAVCVRLIKNTEYQGGKGAR
jgi:hypothetical protein